MSKFKIVEESYYDPRSNSMDLNKRFIVYESFFFGLFWLIPDQPAFYNINFAKKYIDARKTKNIEHIY